MECNELIEQLSEYLDPEARAQICREVEEHLTRCRDCSLYVDTVRKTIVIARSVPAPATPITLNDQLQAALTRAYQTRAEATASD